MILKLPLTTNHVKTEVYGGTLLLKMLKVVQTANQIILHWYYTAFCMLALEIACVSSLMICKMKVLGSI